MSTRREDIALLAPKGCVGCELGVAAGGLTRRFLDLGHFSEFHAVDKWDDAGHPLTQYHAAQEYLKGYEELTIWRSTAQEWLKTIPDGSLGFVYIDCYAHTGQDSGSILRAAWPKLADGGLFSGDDYDKRAWKYTFESVNRFAKSVGHTISVWDKHLNGSGKRNQYDNSPSWYFIKRHVLDNG